uniref:Uncharacterized protein n=1 Tax=Plectus sambesii TaxID=2011161 RepID=A0A914WPX9_9BILA
MVEPPQHMAMGGTRQRSASRDRADAGVGSVQGHLSQMMFNAGREKLQDTFNSYGRVDLLRPYFDVDPKQ